MSRPTIGRFGGSATAREQRLLDRLERSDILNAAALAAVLLLLGLGLLRLGGMFSETVDEGLWEAEGGDDLPADVIAAPQASLRPPNEITVLVGNGSEGRQGLAGRATSRLGDIGYGTLEAVNKEASRSTTASSTTSTATRSRASRWPGSSTSRRPGPAAARRSGGAGRRRRRDRGPRPNADF